MNRRTFLKQLVGTAACAVTAPAVNTRFSEYLLHWLRYDHFGPVARRTWDGYVLRCRDEKSIRTLLIEAPDFERIDFRPVAERQTRKT